MCYLTDTEIVDFKIVAGKKKSVTVTQLSLNLAFSKEGALRIILFFVLGFRDEFIRKVNNVNKHPVN